VRRVVPLLTVLTLAFAPVPVPKAARKTDRELLCGTWELVSQNSAGVPEKRELKWVITERATEMTHEHGTHRWEVVLDQSGDPKTIDLRIVIQGTARPPYKGLYALDGDELRVSYDALARHIRPKDIKGSGRDEILWIFRRKKP
jgi:uncharacterized protein (TIGR03067 family)